MKRLLLMAAAAILLFGGATAAIIGWLERLPPPVVSAPAPAPAGPTMVELPPDPVERERAMEENQARFLFESLRAGFLSAERTPAAEARLRPALEALFPGRRPSWTLECRRLVCRLEVEARAAEWRQPFATSLAVRPHLERVAFDPDGEKLAFVELVEARLAAADSQRPEGDRILEGLEQGILASEEVRRCLAEGPSPEGAEIRLTIDSSGVTYRFGTAVDSKVAYCLMMQALPDLMATVSAPARVRRAERVVRIRASP